MTQPATNEQKPADSGADGEWIPLCRSEDVWEGCAKRIDIEGEEPLAVFCLDSDYYVTADTCSHGEASLCDGIVEGGEVECPWHNGRFDIKTGTPTGYPAVTPIRVYRTKVVDGEVFFSKT